MSSQDFDPIVELLAPTGASIARVDDFRGSQRAVLYQRLSASNDNRTFFLVVTAADATRSGIFSVSVDLNPFASGDDEEVQAIDVGDLFDLARGGPVVDSLEKLRVGFRFDQLETEVFFSLAVPTRLAISVEPTTATATPPADFLFLDPGKTTLVGFDEAGAPTEQRLVIERAVSDPLNGPRPGTLWLYSTDASGSHLLPAGDYVLLLRGQGIPLADPAFDVVFQEIELGASAASAAP